MKRFWIAILLIAPLEAQWLKVTTPGIPRTPDGKPNLTAAVPKTSGGAPDLSGMWRMNAGSHAANIASALELGDVQPWAAALHQKRKDDLGKDSFSVACLPAGPLYSVVGGPEGVKIVQTPSLIVFLYGDLAFRQVFLDGRSLPNDPNPTWMGYSIGHWDGDTLVVESNGFNDRTWLDFEGHPHSEALRVTERFQRVNFGHMNVNVTFQDPAVYARPIRIDAKAEAITDTEMLEYVCAENERDRAHLVGKASDDKAVEIATSVLSRYVGAYEAENPIVPGAKVSFEIRVEGKQLVADGEMGKMSLTAVSESEFSANGTTLRFAMDPDGVMTATFKVVEGDFKTRRKQ